MNAADLDRMLGDSAVRQSRPLYILIASIIGRPIQWLFNKIDHPVFKRIDEKAGQYIGFYAGYVFINFLMLFISLLLFDSIVTFIAGKPINIWLLTALQVFLVSNEITKAFFWTAHQQFFSVLTPLITIWISLNIVACHKSLSNISKVSLLLGLLMLSYGNFLPAFATILIIAFLNDRKPHAIHTIKNIALFLLPTALWIGYCIYQNGHYYNHEAEKYRQLIWISDTLQISGSVFWEELARNIAAFFSTFKEILFFIVAATTGTWYIYLWHPQHKKNIQPILINTGVLVLFFALLGFYEERLTYTLLSPCLCIIAMALSLVPDKKRMPALVMTCAAIWHVWNVLSYGPFS